MSKTLSRPMFRRGGKVDSRGTGITSGLMPRQNYAEGDLVVAGSQPETQTTQPKGPSRFGQSFVGTTLKGADDFIKKNVNIPLSQIFAEGVYNPASTAVNAIGSLFGYGDISPYLQSNITKNEPFGGTVFPEFVSKEEYFNRPLFDKTTTELPEAPVIDQSESNQQGEKTVTMDEKKDPPEVQNTNKGVDVDAMEDIINADAKAFEKVMLGDSATKDKIFKMLTAAAPKLLEEDYGGAIAEAGKAGDDTAVKQKAREAALSKYITDNADTPQIKNLEALKDIFPNATNKELAGYVFDSGTQKAPNAIVLKANADKMVEESTSPDSKLPGMAAGIVAGQLNQDVTLIRYNPKDTGKVVSKDNPLVPSIEINPGQIYFDPKDSKYKVGYSDGTIKSFNSYSEANINKTKL